MPDFPLNQDNGAPKLRIGGVDARSSDSDRPSTPLSSFDNWRRLDEIVIDVIKGLKNAPKT